MTRSVNRMHGHSRLAPFLAIISLLAQDRLRAANRDSDPPATRLSAMPCDGVEIKLGFYVAHVKGFADGLEQNCTLKGIKVRGSALNEIYKVGMQTFQRLLAKPEARDDVWLIGLCVTDRGICSQLISGRVSPVLKRFEGSLGLLDLPLMQAVNRQMIAKWKEIASPEQLRASDYVLNQRLYSEEGFQKRVAMCQRWRSGRFSARDIDEARIDVDGSQNPATVPTPTFEFILCDLYFRPMADLFRESYRLTNEQAAALDAIIVDCRKRAVDYRERHTPELKAAWNRVVVATLGDNANSRHTAVREYRALVERGTRPFALEFEQRIDALLTSQQRAAGPKPVKKPDWLALREAMDTETAATSEPAAQAASRTAR